MHPKAPDLSGLDTVNVVPWPESPTATPGAFDPRSPYAEHFWLPILGPSTMWLMRHLAHQFDVEPDGFVLDIAEAAAAIGIGTRVGRSGSFQRSINRLVGFNMGRGIDRNTLAIRRTLPPLHSGQIRRLSKPQRRLHTRMLGEHLADADEDRRRARKVASTLLRLGDSPDLVEQQLVVWGVRPALAKDAVDIAWAEKARSEANRAIAAHH